MRRHRSQSNNDSKISRRGLFKNVTAGTIGAALGVPSLFSPPSGPAQGAWLRQADIVVVGTGAAGSSAALNSQRLGNSVLLVEKASFYGGTTAKSGGEYWIPNNSLMRAQGIQDSREDAMRYMVRMAYPYLYNPEDPHLGIAPDQHEVLGAFYDNATLAVDALHSMTTIRSRFKLAVDGTPFMDYRADLPENKLIRGRPLGPKTATGEDGRGPALIAQMREAVVHKGIPILFRHRASRLLLNSGGAVTGLEVKTPDGAIAAIRARKAVIFGSGGFTHNRELRLSFLRGPIFGGCAVQANEGDFIGMATAAGATLSNMNNAWWAQVVLEQTLNSTSTPMDVFYPPGDSMILVNRYGRRIVNEAVNYNDRTQVHFIWDAARNEYPNLLVFMIYDQRTADRFAGTFPIPRRGLSSVYLLSGQTIEELSRAVDARLEQLAGRTGNVRLDGEFGERLQQTIARFNGFATLGVDEDFHRGEKVFERVNRQRMADNDNPNPRMYPISTDGPYYAIILAPGTLDTHGGPKINARGQIVDSSGKPIPGLYGAGNCVGFPSGQAYWGYGGTIGPALTFGYIAAQNASKEIFKAVDGESDRNLASRP